MAICATCKSSVEDGATRCFSCDATLSIDASFAQVVGWVLAGVSSIPIGLGIVLEGERNHWLLIIGGGMLAGGLITALIGRARARHLPPTVLPDPEPDALA